MKIDLHMHSNYSRDGEFSPKELIKKAKEKNLDIIALCDHNEMAGIDEMIQYGKQVNIDVIPAIEFDTLFNGMETHLLGYNIDYHLPYYQELSKNINQLMDQATHQRIETFKKVFHVELNEKEILEKAGDGNPFFTMVEIMFNDPKNQNIEAFKPYLPGGERDDPAIPNFYWDLCSKGNPCYVEVKYPDFKECVDRIHKDGGIAIIAHPFNNFYLKEDYLQQAINYGIDGLEAYSNYHTPAQNEFYDQYCRQHNLLMSCGSDFHGALKPNIEMGEYGYLKNDLEDVIQPIIHKLNR